jgi:hypothetical protein
MQVYVPEPLTHARDLPAPVIADPALAEMEVTFAAGYVKLHWTAAGSLPDGEVRFRFRDKVPLDVAAPDDKARESVWAKPCRAETR